MLDEMNLDLDAIDRRATALVQSHRVLMQKLVGMRAKHHLTQADVAERMGVSQPTVAAFERYDSNPTLSTIRRYALAVEACLEEDVVDDCASMRRLEAIATDSPAPRFRPTRPMPNLAPSVWATVPAIAVPEYV